MFAMQSKNPLTSRIALVCLLLAGCGAAPDFVHAPPASYLAPLAPAVHGVWARVGKDNGERVRVSGLADGTVRIDFFKTRPSAQPVPEQPLMAQALHFDNTDWLLIDMRKLSALDGGKYTGSAPYRLIRYVLDDAGRLCGSEPGAHLFGEAIEAGKLEGKVTADVMPRMRVTVTSAGADWVTWWSLLPASVKTFSQPALCFEKMD